MVTRVLTALGLATALSSIYACSSGDPALGEEAAAVDAPALTSPALPPRPEGASVFEHHGNASRDGLYVDPALTPAAAASMHKDLAFDGAVTGQIYAQPLYIENGPGGREAFIVVTEENHVVALDSTGRPIWDKTFGEPARSGLPCGNIRPLGITGTPVVDPATRTIYFDAMTTVNGGLKHLIWAISLEDGSARTGWPLDFVSILPGTSAKHHNQRGALALVNGTLYVPYGGHFGDCDPYKGTVIAVPLDSPTRARGWSIEGKEGGIWSVGGVASDGLNAFATTGNTTGTSGWAGGEAIIRLKPGASFSNQPVDFFAPTNWKQLDDGDVDLGGANPVLVDMPGAPVPRLVLAFGKDANLYIVNRDNLGGIGGQLTNVKVMSGAILGASAAYKTERGTYVAIRAQYGRGLNCPVGGRGNIAVVRITPTNPPRAEMAWCTDEKLGSPMVTSVDGQSKAIVWDANDRLWGYDGDTGEKVFAGGGSDDTMGGAMQYFNTPIAAKGRIVVAGPSRLVVFKP